MDIDAKRRPFYIAKILYERTDENHSLTTNEICDLLKSEYGFNTYRKTIKSDIELLQSVGIDVNCFKAKQNRYQVLARQFDLTELKLLIDAVASSRFISKNRSNQLTAKIMDLAGKHKAAELKRNLIVNNRIRTDVSTVFLYVEIINEAINLGRKISFQMAEYNIRKERVLHNKGEVYVFSPYSLLWDGDNYYVIGYSEKFKAITSHRVDRIYNSPSILDEAIVPMPKGFDINEHVNTMFNMFTEERREVELVCDNDMMDKVIDKFGTGVTTYANDMTSFRAVVNVATSPVFYAWVFTFGGKIRIKAPADVKEEFIRLAKAAVESN